MLKNYLGKNKLRSITYGDIKRLIAERLKTQTQHGNQRSITTVNRELQLLRRIFKESCLEMESIEE